jgi:hypothetical protein
MRLAQQRITFIHIQQQQKNITKFTLMINRLVKAILPNYSDEQMANSSYVFTLKFFVNLLWLLAGTFTVYYFEIEKNKGFDRVAVILSGAFCIYIFTPLKFRKLFLVVLALLVEIYLFGINISLGVTLFIIYFVALTYVKHKTLRNVLVLMSTLVFMAITSKLIVLPFVRLVVMFGALFLMLRYIYLLYEINYFKIPPVFIDRLCYLFLIPNACFPLIPALSPVVYLSSFYNQPSEVSFRRGLNWITVGIIHLLIYRVIYLYFSPSPYEIDGFGMWVWFILSSYSLIFRLSGLFYLAMGFLQLFGFNLPNIFNHVYFTTGFADLWRRVNLYWRAMMTRVFYYPLIFKLKKVNQKFVIWFVTLLMFGFTWLLHSWQWYWIKGTYYFYATDMIFWFTLGIIISCNAVRAFNKLNSQKEIPNKRNYFLEAGKVIFMFFAMSLLWSLWTASSLKEFFYIFKFAKSGTLNEYLMFIGIVVLLVFFAGVIRTLHLKRNWFTFIFNELNPLVGIGLCVIVVTSLEVLKTSHNEVAQNFVNMSINNRDKIILERGYYEQILNNDDKLIELMNVGSKFKKWNLDRDAYRKTNNELIKEFIPNYKTSFKGDTLYTNSFGLRDKFYNLKKDSGVVRISIVGGSYVMGSGVSNEENFPALIEDTLNALGVNKIEVLNYGVGGYFLIQNVFVVENKITDYKPDYLFFFIHSSYRTRCIESFANLLQRKAVITSPYLKSITERAGIKDGMCHLEMYNRLKPFVDDIFEWGYKSMYKVCETNNIELVMVYLPANASLKTDNEKESCISEATKIGFHVIDLSDVYFGYKPEEIQLSSWDSHPNEKGHLLISNLLLEKMKKDKHFFKFIP